MKSDYALFVLKRLATYEAAILAATAIACLVAGWHSVNEISMALLAAGALAFSVGAFSMMGGWGTTRNFQYLYTRSIESTSSQERMSQDKREIDRNISLIIPSVLLGTITMVIGVVFQITFS